MKKSNLVLVIALVLISFFFLAFQAIMHDYMDKVDKRTVASKFVEEIRTVSAFKKIHSSQDALIFFQQDSITKVKIEAPESLLYHIKTEVRGDTLIINKTKEIREKDSVKIVVSNPNLDEVNISSGTSFETIGRISGKNLNLVFSDESTGNLDLSYESVTCNAISGSKVKIKGDSHKIDFSNE